MQLFLPALAFAALVIAQFTAVIAAAREMRGSRTAFATRLVKHRLA
jgi:hypothetical protein